MNSRADLAHALFFLLLLVTALAVVGTVEKRSLDPDTDCAWNQVLTSDGTCR